MSTSSSKNPSTSSLISLNEQAVSPILASSSNTSWDLHADDFTKELSCSLCLELFKEPVILPCGHNFCKSCLEAIWNKKGVFCPECHVNVPERKFIINQALEKMAEKIKTFHVGGQQQKCMEHGEPLTLYWKPQGKLACFTCREAQMPKDQCSQFLLIPDAVQMYTVNETLRPWSPSTVPRASQREASEGCFSRSPLNILRYFSSSATLQ